jgi:hypothetical protein
MVKLLSADNQNRRKGFVSWEPAAVYQFIRGHVSSSRLSSCGKMQRILSTMQLTIKIERLYLQGLLMLLPLECIPSIHPRRGFYA